MRVHWSPPLAIILALMLAGGMPGRAAETDGAQDEIGYSTVTNEPPATGKARAAPSPETTPGVSPRAAKPEISITLDKFGKLPPEAVPAIPRPATPRHAAPPSAPAQQAPAVTTASPPRQAAPSRAPAPALPASGSPIMAMLENTLHGRYEATLTLKERMPKKIFQEKFNRAAANTLSRQGNTLLNKRGDMAGALEAYAEAYAKDKSSSEINGSYGYALFRNGRFPEARDKEIESLEIAPGYGAAWFVLGQIFGSLEQEDYAYASFVNTCLFTRNIHTTLGFLDREKDKDGAVCAQRAAARALETCRGLAARGTQPAPPPTSTAGPETRTPRIGKIDFKKIVLNSRQFPQLLAKLAEMDGASKRVREQRLETLVVPILTAIRALTRRYATAHAYAIVIPVAQEPSLRRGGPLGPDDFPLVDVAPAVLLFLNSPKGRLYRETVAIDDLTQPILRLFNAR